MQTARTTPKGEIEAGFSVLRIEALAGEELEYELTDGGAVPAVEGWARFGLKENFDLGVKIGTIAYTSLNVDTKWQFHGDQESFFAMGTGIGLGGGVNRDQQFMYGIHFPLYTSIHPTEWMSLFLNPRVIMQGQGSFITHSYFGGSIGVFLGKEVKFGIEASLFQLEGLGAETISTTIFQTGIGLTVLL